MDHSTFSSHGIVIVDQLFDISPAPSAPSPWDPHTLDLAPVAGVKGSLHVESMFLPQLESGTLSYLNQLDLGYLWNSRYISVESLNCTVLTNSLLHMPSPSIRSSGLRTQPSPPATTVGRCTVMFGVWSLCKVLVGLLTMCCWSPNAVFWTSWSTISNTWVAFKYRGNCWWASAMARCFVIQHACICQADCPNKSLRKGRTAYKQCKSCPATSISTGKVLEPNTLRREREGERVCWRRTIYNFKRHVYDWGQNVLSLLFGFITKQDITRPPAWRPWIHFEPLDNLDKP